MAGAGANNALTELSVDDIVDLSALGFCRDEGIKTKTLDQVVAVESTFHGVTSSKQSRTSKPGAAKSTSGRVSDVQQL